MKAGARCEMLPIESGLSEVLMLLVAEATRGAH